MYDHIVLVIPQIRDVLSLFKSMTPIEFRDYAILII